MIKKKCFKCLLVKPITEFYKHPQMADGHLGKCKECTKKDSRDRGSDPEYERSRANLPHRIALRLAYQKTARGQAAMRRGKKRYAESTHGKAVKACNTKQYRKNNPAKYRAHQKVMNALRNGTLVKQPCEQCEAKRVHAHHDDYSKPLKVRWLCPKCHKVYHKEVLP